MFKSLLGPSYFNLIVQLELPILISLKVGTSNGPSFAYDFQLITFTTNGKLNSLTTQSHVKCNPIVTKLYT